MELAATYSGLPTARGLTFQFYPEQLSTYLKVPTVL